MTKSHDGAGEPVVPFLSSSAVGPLGAAHLPRMWMKILLHATGRLPKGYRHGTGGFDEKTAIDLGFDRDEFIRFVETELPTYMECEAWVRKHAKHLDAETIRKHNEGLHRDKPAAMAVAQRAFVGLKDPTILDATLLNDLDDWMTAHALVTKGSLPSLAISSLNAEFTELLKTVLDAAKAARATIHTDLPALGLSPANPFAEAKRRSAPENLDEDDKLEGEVFLGKERVAWILVFGAAEKQKGTAALEKALARATKIFEEVSSPVSVG
jgi:hypothetical protein